MRAAAQSTCFHGVCSGDPRATEMMALLSDDELTEMMAWKRPGDVDLGEGLVLRYADAEKELAVALTATGDYCEPDSPDAITVGHLDFAWVVETRPNGIRIAYVADIKRSEWTVKTGPDGSLQLHAYGLAYAGKHKCDGYAVGIWSAIEGLWSWSGIVDLESERAMQLALRVTGAARNVGGDYSMGPHCRDCYGRMRCPAWLLPPEMAQTSLAPLVRGGVELTHDRAAQLLLVYQRYSDAAKQVHASLQEFARRNGGIRDKESGKVWLPVVCQGRESVTVAAVRELADKLGDEGEPLRQLITKGKPYEQYRWTDAK